MELEGKIKETLEFLRRKGVGEPETGIILGSGLNDYADRIKDALVLSYNEIPNMEAGKVPDHRGQLVYGEYLGHKVMIMAGRFHYYENRDMDKTAYPATVMAALGVKRFIITNASGCINESFGKGRLMLISDHINLSGDNPLKGRNLDELGPRFPDMSFAYSSELRASLIKKAAAEGIELCEGVYCMMSGPAFETPAEIRFLRIIGADAVGMSTVPEALVAAHAGREIIGISLLANMAAGMTGNALSGEEVAETATDIRDTFSRVVDLAIEL